MKKGGDGREENNGRERGMKEAKEKRMNEGEREVGRVEKISRNEKWKEGEGRRKRGRIRG